MDRRGRAVKGHLVLVVGAVGVLLVASPLARRVAKTGGAGLGLAGLVRDARADGGREAG